jgi:hypothetical protein
MAVLVSTVSMNTLASVLLNFLGNFARPLRWSVCYILRLPLVNSTIARTAFASNLRG